jgi:hypothetical protein
VMSGDRGQSVAVEDVGEVDVDAEQAGSDHPHIRAISDGSRSVFGDAAIGRSGTPCLRGRVNFSTAAGSSGWRCWGRGPPQWWAVTPA